MTECSPKKPTLHRIITGVRSFFGNVRREETTTLTVPAKLRPSPHSYAGYSGPWIENYFYSYWKRHQLKLPESEKLHRIYIPIFWTDYYLKRGLKEGHAEIRKFLDRNIRPDKNYFTVVQHDDGIKEELPKNVLIFAAGGVGDIPIPLLKGVPKYVERPRDILCSFMGPLNGPHNKTGVRALMYEALKNDNAFHFGRGTFSEFTNVTSRSIFTLCPRGYGRTSFRLYEAMALGSIPIYLWDDKEWLPYQNQLNWDEFSIRLNIRDINRLTRLMNDHTPEIIKLKQEKIKALQNDYFTFEGTCKRIVEMLTGC